MVVKLSVSGFKEDAEALLEQAATQKYLLEHLKPLWQIIGARIARHIWQRWESEGIFEMNPLADSTLDARFYGTGHYKQKQKFVSSGPEERQFWWTGRSLQRATSDRAYSARNRSMTYHFGPKDATRDKLTWMHFGNAAQNREPRPLYDEVRVGTIVAQSAQEYIEVVTQGGDVFSIRNRGAA